MARVRVTLGCGEGEGDALPYRSVLASLGVDVGEAREERCDGAAQVRVELR